MGQFQALVLRPFRTDLEEWAAHGWCGPRPGIPATAGLFARHAGLRATIIHRVAHWATASGVRGLPMFLQAANLWLHGIEISPSIPIGPGFYLPHTAGSVIHAERIGAHVEMQGGLTIGQRADDGFPTIEDRVLLGAGCRVLGPLTLGAGSRIGANAVVLTHVPAGCTAVGVPARIVATTPATAERTA